jgi:hypothetical protein
VGDTHTDTKKHTREHSHRQQGDLINLPLFFQNKEIRLVVDAVFPIRVHFPVAIC